LNIAVKIKWTVRGSCLFKAPKENFNFLFTCWVDQLWE